MASSYDNFVAQVNKALAEKGEKEVVADEQPTLMGCYENAVNVKNAVGSVTFRRAIMSMGGLNKQ